MVQKVVNFSMSFSSKFACTSSLLRIKLRILCVQHRIVLNLNLRLHALPIYQQCTVLIDKIPLFLLIRRRFRRDNRVLPNTLTLYQSGLVIHDIFAIGITGVLCVQRAARELRPVQTGWLLSRVVAEADSDHLGTICGAEVERIRRVGCAQLLVLEEQNLGDSFAHRGVHVLQWVLLLPAVLAAVVGQVRHVERGSVLGVRGAENIAVGVEGHKVSHIAADGGEVRNDAVMHEDVAPEDERVRVDGCDDAAAGSADVGEDAVGFGVVAERLEVEVVDGRRLGFVEGWARASDVLDVG